MSTERMDALKREADCLSKTLKAIGKKERIAHNRRIAETHARGVLALLYFAENGFLTAKQRRAVLMALEMPETSIRRWKLVLALADEIMIIGKG